MPHTPGPWKWSESIGAVVVDRPDMQYVVAPLWRAEVPAGMESEALDNARLIAAAPDLLEALEACLARLEGESEWLDKAGYPAAWMVQRHDAILSPARAAIAKAKGE